MLYSKNILSADPDEYLAIGKTPVIYASSTYGLSFNKSLKNSKKAFLSFSENKLLLKKIEEQEAEEPVNGEEDPAKKIKTEELVVEEATV